VQKSQASFKELVNIVSDPDFRPSDIREAKWGLINEKLAGDKPDEEWCEQDAGWKRTSVTIPVPFHRKTAHPGTKEYTVADFYYRSLVSVIREHLTDPTRHRHFHYEPYELYWQPQDTGSPTRVHGEVYTSPTFIQAHRELQDLPREASDDLPRVVVALMFSSDSTHLTSFGDTKLWPLYLYFGNESKYRRCRPSCHLCSHIAYFKKVSPYSMMASPSLKVNYFSSFSFQPPSRTLLPRTSVEKALTKHS